MRFLALTLLCACMTDLEEPESAALASAVVSVFTVLPSATSLPGSEPIGAPNNDGVDQCAANERPNRGHWLYYSSFHTDDPNVPQKLLVFLAGHGELPQSYPDFIQAARDQGYYVIALDYPNSIDQSLSQACDGTDDACYWEHRYEIAFGEEKSSSVSHISTCPEEDIANRLRRLLIYLRQNSYPGWDQFTYWDAADQLYKIHWNNVALAGHSGFAAFIANHKDVYRVIMLAEVADAWGNPLQPAPWLTTHATASSRYYGLVHHDDTNFFGNDIVAKVEMNWIELGLTGPLYVYDPQGSIPSGTHRIESDEPVQTGVQPHFDITRNAGTYTKAWKYMLGKGD
jgi:hypothetical protein